MNDDKRREILFKGIKFYCNLTLESPLLKGLPVHWIDRAMKSMAFEKQDEPTERIKELINFIIDETEQVEKVNENRIEEPK